MSTVEVESALLSFFEMQFGRATGYLEIGTQSNSTRKFESSFFLWPREARAVIEHIQLKAPGNDVWFGTSLLAQPKRSKDNVVECYSLWNDLDTCQWQSLEPKPNIAIQSSPGRYQGIWTLDQPVAPAVAEEYSRRMAKAHDGIDDGWFITKLLRVPYTYNYKYAGAPEVELLACLPMNYPIQLFEHLPPVPGNPVNLKIEMPDPTELRSAEEIVSDYKPRLPDTFDDLYENTPFEDADWSKLFYRMCNLLLEAGITLEETFAVALEAGCNKFNRDNKDPSYTWADVCRIYSHYNTNTLNKVGKGWAFPGLVSTAEIPTDETFVERYVKWASTQTDAPIEYHEAGAFVILSALLSGTVRIPTSIGTLYPNLWVMILADTTVTRKTTVMNLATSLVDEVIEDTLVATDGSVEGLLQSLSFRPGTPSIFSRDEISGLLDMMARKDYMSGMLEMLTQLYDGKRIRRVLKKETIEVRKPIFIIFAAGIKNRTQSILTHEHIASGFIPRFMIISATQNVSDLRPLGPRTEAATREREALIAEMVKYKQRYVDDIIVPTTNGNAMSMRAPEIDAELTDEAWQVYNEVEKKLLQSGALSNMDEYMMPVFDRMAKNMLKMATLIAAVRQVPERGIIKVTAEDIHRATGYVQKWAPHMIDLVGNIGQSANERILQNVLRAVTRNGHMMRSDVMRQYKVTAFEMDAIVKTLEQRDLIGVTKQGRGYMLWPK